jgi:hypothetical protein
MQTTFLLLWKITSLVRPRSLKRWMCPISYAQLADEAFPYQYLGRARCASDDENHADRRYHGWNYIGRAGRRGFSVQRGQCRCARWRPFIGCRVGTSR